MAKARKNNGRIHSFDFQAGDILARKYEIIDKVGSGWEGEVFRIRERSTGIERAAKIFFPHRNRRDKSSKFYARKLHKLRDCPILIQYHSQETISYNDYPVTVLISELVEGEPLSDFLTRHPGKRITPFQGVILLHALAKGIEKIHRIREYHGDLHSGNIIIRHHGLGFDLKIIDLFQWEYPRRENINDDVVDLIRLFYDAIGGPKHYAKHPREIKAICCGLKRSLILKKFKTAGQLRTYLENMEWE